MEKKRLTAKCRPIITFIQLGCKSRLTNERGSNFLHNLASTRFGGNRFELYAWPRYPVQGYFGDTRLVGPDWTLTQTSRTCDPVILITFHQDLSQINRVKLQSTCSGIARLYKGHDAQDLGNIRFVSPTSRIPVHDMKSDRK